MTFKHLTYSSGEVSQTTKRIIIRIRCVTPRSVTIIKTDTSHLEAIAHTMCSTDTSAEATHLCSNLGKTTRVCRKWWCQSHRWWFQTSAKNHFISLTALPLQKSCQRTWDPAAQCWWCSPSSSCTPSSTASASSAPPPLLPPRPDSPHNQIFQYLFWGLPNVSTYCQNNMACGTLSVLEDILGKLFFRQEFRRACTGWVWERDALTTKPLHPIVRNSQRGRGIGKSRRTSPGYVIRASCLTCTPLRFPLYIFYFESHPGLLVHSRGNILKGLTKMSRWKVWMNI